MCLRTLLILCVSTGVADAQTLNIGQYTHTAWRIRDGFANTQITAIAQTPDGYLWLGTSLGLLRFDGIRATPWRPARGRQLSSEEITDLLVARDSTLWIGTARGLFSTKNGELEAYPELTGVGVTHLLQTRDGTIWLGTIGPGRLCGVREREVTCSQVEGFGVLVTALFEDRKGTLWVSAEHGVWRWAPGPPTQAYVASARFEVASLGEDDTGALLMGTATGLKALSNGHVRNDPFPQTTGQPSTQFFRSRDGALWIANYRGLLHIHDGRAESFGLAQGLSGAGANNVFEDAEGNLWVSTNGGLDRFRAPAIPTLSVDEGLATSNVMAIQSASDGNIWIVEPHGLWRWAHGRLDSVTPPSGNARALGLDNLGRLLAATDEGVNYLERGRFNRVRGVPGGQIFGIAGDSRGNLWVLSGFDALFRVGSDSSVRRFKVEEGDVSTTLLPAEDHGGAWVGFFRGGLSRITEQGRIAVSYTTSDGLGAGRVVDLRRGSDSSIWISTAGGLSRLANGRIATLTSRNGLPCDGANWAIEDDDRALWIWLRCGLVRVARAEIEAWMQDPERRVAVTAFEADDGAVPMGLMGSVGPHVTKSPDGRIWFPSLTGVSVIDPRHLRVNRIPPPVHVERIVADGKVYDLQSGTRERLSLPPRIRNLAIDYTALSLVAPEKTRFRFKLEAQDTGWREVVNQRHVEYSNLRPGTYRFHLTAANNSGVWNTQGTTIDFRIASAFSQTNWFRGLIAAAVLGTLWAVYRLRIRQLRLREERFRETIETMPALTFVALPNGERTFYNRRWTDYTGVTLAEAAGAGWRAIVHPEDLPSVLAKWNTAVATGNPLEYELRLRNAAGDYRWFFTRATPVRDSRGHITKWYGVATDIEDRKRAEQERERLRQLEADLAHVNRVSTLGELTASLAHEIRQPITATMTNASVTLRYLDHAQPDLEKVRTVAKRILRDSARADEIIVRLRSLYKKAPPKREIVDVCEVIREVVVLLQSEARRHLVSMRLELAIDRASTNADRVQLQQVFLNLMLNGIEAMKGADGGQLLVTAQAEPPELLLSVRDSGVGLPGNSVDQIFAPFFTTKPNGTGMGLSICRSIVESHGGRLWAMPNDDRGATFHFTLPAA